MRIAIPLFVVAIAALIVGFNGIYTLSEVEQAIITRFGKPVGGAITKPGLHFKTPFVHTVHRFDKRWLEWDGEADEMPTKEKTYIVVDTYARWRIVDPLKFFTSVHDELGAQSRLDDIITSETRNVIAAHRLIDVVRTSDRSLTAILPGKQAAPKEGVKDIVGREKLTRLILKKSQLAMPEYGIELVDVQFQRVNYTESVEKKVFERMISERQSIAAQYRSEGEGEAARIRGQKERELKIIESQAYLQQQQIKGKADATATGIYANAYNRDPKLFRLTKSLDSYSKTLDPNTTLVLSTESEYLKSLVNGYR